MGKDWTAMYIDEDFTDRELRQKMLGAVMCFYDSKKKEEPETAKRFLREMFVKYGNLFPRKREEERESLENGYEFLKKAVAEYGIIDELSIKGLAASSFIRGLDIEESFLWPMFCGGEGDLATFTPVILAAGRNERFGEVSKPVQPVGGTPQLLRLISQLKKAGFEEKDVYVVTKAGYGYQSEPFQLFHQGIGKDVKINNVSFRDADIIQRADVVKRFADGALEYAERVGDDWKFTEEKRELRKNLLVLHADNIFYSEAPVRMFLERGGRALNEEKKGYCIFEMFRYGPENNGEPFSDISAYALDRKAYSEAWEGVDKSKEKISISKDVCTAIGKGGDGIRSRMAFSNMNDVDEYNTALITTAHWRRYDEFVRFLEKEFGKHAS